MINAQTWLDENYPEEDRNKIIELDISKIKFKNWTFNKNLKGDLKIEGFINLKILIISSYKLTGLDVSDCINLEEIICTDHWDFDNAYLNFDGCLKLKKKDTSKGKTIFNDLFFHKIMFRNLDKYLNLNLNDNFQLHWSDFNVGFSKISWVGNQYQECWEKSGFSFQEAKEWIESGFGISSYEEVIRWKNLFAVENLYLLRDFELVLDKSDYKSFSFYCYKKDCKPFINEELIEICKEYLEQKEVNGFCLNCNQINNSPNFCQPCASRKEVESFIEKYKIESESINIDEILQWIPYNNLRNIEYLAEGGFGKVYKSNWIYFKDGYYDNIFEEDRKRINKKVVLKILNDSRDIKEDFLKEIGCHKSIDIINSRIVKCHGISQDPNGNYLMIMDYIDHGNLRNYLNNHNHLSFEVRLKQLHYISQGLMAIHDKGLIHRDFHLGNMLSDNESSYITDLGLCRPANEKDDSEKVYGVLSYIAPEVLQGQSYTQSSDIYSFAISAYEILTGFPPYYDRSHDVNLGLEICKGLRPEFKIKIPTLLKYLIDQCLDNSPLKRPNIREIWKCLDRWNWEVSDKKETEFFKQFKEAEEYNKSLPDEIKSHKYEVNSGAFYHSKHLPTKEITCLMKFNLLNKTLDLSEHLIKARELSLDGYKKHKDLKYALKLILESSVELETIIISNHLNISEDTEKIVLKIKELKIKSKELQEKDDSYNKIQEKKSQKEKELEKLKNHIFANRELDTVDLSQISELLKKQELSTKNNDEESSKALEIVKRTIKKLKMVDESDVNSLCQLQSEITKLDFELNQNINNQTKQINQIIIHGNVIQSMIGLNNVSLGDFSPQQENIISHQEHSIY
ncbi:MAG: Serine/threonine-protein kinase PknD [Mycoplasmataceae bacterium]|nr:Serine/threonine-protein kinase PknD [Mycoplasmataceae bacterium]WNE41375.1 MAG: Serine/threonine-protein kinase PknD [Mycoplasmataceae bacterium]